MKRVFTVFLAVCLLASVGIAAFADASDFPWGSLDVQQIVISGGVSRLRAEPYKGMTGITEVVISASVKSVDEDAFAGSAISVVKTAGDPGILKSVKAFENAEIIQISHEEYDAIVSENQNAAMHESDTYVYDSVGKRLLVKSFEKKFKTPFGTFFYYEDEGANGGGGSGLQSFDLYDDDGNVIGKGKKDAQGRWVSREWTYRNEDGVVGVGTFENTYNEDGSWTTVMNVKYSDGFELIKEKTTYDKDGKPTLYTVEYEDADGTRTESEVTEFHENGGVAEETYKRTFPDGQIETGTDRYDEDGNVTYEKSTHYTDTGKVEWEHESTYNTEMEYNYDIGPVLSDRLY